MHYNAGMPTAFSGRTFWLSVFALLIAAAIWLPLVHRFYCCASGEYKCETGVPPRAARLAKHQLQLLQQSPRSTQEREAMRAVNPEWDLMGRTYLVLSLVNMAKREPAQTTEYLKSVDQIIDETLQMEAEYGPLHFLMPYARAQPWVLQPPRSQFVDSEMAMMLAARRALEDSPRYAEEVRQRIG